ncbi:MAG: bifunctional acetate--CoA ligase family protein/GNAT family N-acetyltransferase [Propionivibrio sp.]|uniref:bifunctional acetate--CoA ligase family protein/GNAT family N-acetyltransferase n=1 Tax=Propionivibrio sp. TaxID=2212460 RepID=UPI001A4BBD28|nr:bifunctional acetate--CoA ligase family protein/GNAT family N-acetyltransferase [Propionivibrio sp.]MBL8416395.1 bifunctional acetate--CoA ligase family protein/GNAT family N-acetyltransferase [Propionivibrio sp.]
MFAPTSIAVFGATEKEGSIGRSLLQNLLVSYGGQVFPINPKHETVLDRRCFASLTALGQSVDLAVIIAPAAEIPAIMESCGRLGVFSAIIISAGFREAGKNGERLERKMLETARRYGIRILGPRSAGLICPGLGLNLTPIAKHVPLGNIAFISQSSTICAAILDWSYNNEFGFSNIISLGNGADLDFAEIIDYLAADLDTHSILIYMEGLRNSRRFMSAVRAAARIKPVIAVKAGKALATAAVAQEHTGAIVGSDDIFDAALRRAGVVRVQSIGDMFSAARALTSPKRPAGDRLAIITNGGGPAVMATDLAISLGIGIAVLSAQSILNLDVALPRSWSHGNPVDVMFDATTERYKTALTTCLDDEGVDAVLVIFAPNTLVDPEAVAQAIIDTSAGYRKPVLTCWMGELGVRGARASFAASRIPTFRSPENAVEAFHFMVSYFLSQQILLEAPGSYSYDDEPDIENARLIIEAAMAERRHELSSLEAKAILAAFRIPVSRSVLARSPNEAMLIAQQHGFPVAMKIESPGIVHKSDIGGMRLNVSNAQAVRSSYNEIVESVGRLAPEAKIEGISIETFVSRPHGRVLAIGLQNDPVFGPVVTFGEGGQVAEVFNEKSIALPPLNRRLIDDLVERARVARLLKPFRQMPAIDRKALDAVLLRVSEMACELPWISKMEINPLIIDDTGAVAVDARIAITPYVASSGPHAHMAICPYPAHLETSWQLPGGTNFTIRPVRPEDAALLQDFVRGLSNDSRYRRFMHSLTELSLPALARLTQIDYDRALVLIAFIEHDKHDTIIGFANFGIQPDGERCNFGLVTSDQQRNKGLGARLMNSLIEAARDRGLKIIEGEVLLNNLNMFKLMKDLGFAVFDSDDDEDIKLVVKQL